MPASPDRTRWAVVGVAAAVLVAVIVAVVVWPRSSAGNNSSTHPLTFYPSATIAPVERQLAAVEGRADRVAHRWIAKHGTSHDSDFAVFAVGQVGSPPGAAAQQVELAQLRRLEQQRTATGLAAATYLEQHGKKDVWQAYGDAYDSEANNAHHHAKNLIDSAYTLGTAVSDTAKNTYMRLSPYEVDPTLNGSIQRDTTQRNYSFPSGHATLAAAESTVLSTLDPGQAAAFRRLEAEIDYSRLYVAAHYPSDVLRGAFLGRLVGDYTLADHPEWLP